MHLLEQFGKSVVAARKQRKLSQQALADRLGMSKRTIQKLEKAETNSKAETLFLVAAELQISIDEIVLPEKKDIDPQVAVFFADKDSEETQLYLDVCNRIAGGSKKV